jgi:hypothetical protein
VKRNRLWDRIGEHAAVAPSADDRLGGFTFEFEGEIVVVRSPNDTVRISRDFFLNGLRVLVAYELHLEHNEFQGGFAVHDLDGTAELKTRAHRETFSPAEVIGLFKGLLERHA